MEESNSLPGLTGVARKEVALPRMLAADRHRKVRQLRNFRPPRRPRSKPPQRPPKWRMGKMHSLRRLPPPASLCATCRGHSRNAARRKRECANCKMDAHSIIEGKPVAAVADGLQNGVLGSKAAVHQRPAIIDRDLRMLSLPASRWS